MAFVKSMYAGHGKRSAMLCARHAHIEQMTWQNIGQRNLLILMLENCLSIEWWHDAISLSLRFLSLSFCYSHTHGVSCNAFGSRNANRTIAFNTRVEWARDREGGRESIDKALSKRYGNKLCFVAFPFNRNYYLTHKQIIIISVLKPEPEQRNTVAPHRAVEWWSNFLGEAKPKTEQIQQILFDMFILDRLCLSLFLCLVDCVCVCLWCKKWLALVANRQANCTQNDEKSSFHSTEFFSFLWQRNVVQRNPEEEEERKKNDQVCLAF